MSKEGHIGPIRNLEYVAIEHMTINASTHDIVNNGVLHFGANIQQRSEYHKEWRYEAVPTLLIS